MADVIALIKEVKALGPCAVTVPVNGEQLRINVYGKEENEIDIIKPAIDIGEVSKEPEGRKLQTSDIEELAIIDPLEYERMMLSQG
jgi:hypothetical protein